MQGDSGSGSQGGVGRKKSTEGSLGWVVQTFFPLQALVIIIIVVTLLLLLQLLSSARSSSPQKILHFWNSKWRVLVYSGALN